MKKIIIPLLILILAGVSFFIINNKKMSERSIENTHTPEAKDELTELFNGEYFSFKYPKSVSIEEDKNFIWVFSQNDNNSIIKLSKNYLDNNEDLEVNVWWSYFGPQNESQAPYPEDDKSYTFKIGSNNAYYTIYERDRLSFGNEYFYPIKIYVSHNFKIFEINTQKLIEEKNVLTPQQISQAKENEKIFWEILNTLEFK
jgi:hypothetical protein